MPHTLRKLNLHRPLGLSLLLLVVLGGCARFRAPQFTPPAGFATDPRAARLVQTATRADEYAKLFPAPVKLQFAGDITASGSWWRGRQHFMAYYFAYRPGQGDPALRLRGYLSPSGTTLFEILVNEGRMTVLLPGEGAGFQGAIPKDGSPFRARFGVEPWQLNDIFMIGRCLSQVRFRQMAEPGKLVVTPANPAASDVPTRIELDPATGLPMRAVWSAGGQTYSVNYLAWDWFKDSSPRETGAPAAPQLMPRHLEIVRTKPYTLLDVGIDHYQFGAEVPPKIFTLLTDVPVRMHPLVDLNKALGNQ